MLSKSLHKSVSWFMVDWAFPFLSHFHKIPITEVMEGKDLVHPLTIKSIWSALTFKIQLGVGDKA